MTDDRSPPIDRLKALVGLGNPESRYAGNRHNIGFLIVDRIAEAGKVKVRQVSRYSQFCRFSFCGTDTLLVKPQTYMNRSGLAMRDIVERWDIALPHILVVYDDADLPLGKIRLRASGSGGGHNGMKSIIAEVGTDQLPRLRFGIGRSVGAEMADFVLSDFSPQELPVVERAMQRAIEAIRSLWESGLARAMSLFNRDPGDGESNS